MLEEPNRPLKVFLCHASQDKPVVRELSRRLFAEGWIDPWLDEKKLLPGQDWRLKIEEAVETSDIVIICLSNNSVTKEGFVQKELRYAREIALEKPDETIFLIPLRLDDCIVPRGLRFYQWVDYFGEKKGEAYRALIESLKLRHEQKLKLEEVERARKEKQEHEIAERVAREREEREVTEKLAREKATREKVEKEAAEQAREKAAKEKAKRDAAEKAAREKVQRDAAEKAKRERWKRFAAQMAPVNKIFSKAIPFLKIAGFAGIVIGILWVVLPEIRNPFPLFSAAKPTNTVTFTSSPSIPTKTPTMSPTLTLTPTETNTPTLTPTLTPIPQSSILFQKDFEDGLVGEWQQIDEGGIWAVEQEPDGNHYLCGTGLSSNPPQIWYRNKRTLWTDYAFETRVKFIKGHTLYILIRNDLGSNEHYGIAINENGFSLMRTWSMLGGNIPMRLYPGGWYTIRAEIKGDSFGAYIESEYLDSLLVQESTLSPPIINQGGIGYVIGGGDKACFDDIKVWSLR